jgi:hypothetical protein
VVVPDPSPTGSPETEGSPTTSDVTVIVGSDFSKGLSTADSASTP